MSMRDDVSKFIETAGGLNDQSVSIYEKLVNEEYQEFVKSYWEGDANRLNESMDLVWVVLGYCIARGWDVEGAWQALTKANMAKLQVDPDTGELKRRADGKIMKPEGWVKPDFSPFLTRSF